MRSRGSATGKRTVVVSNRHPGLTTNAAEIKRLIRELDASGRFRPPPGELSIVFLTSDDMADLHRQFLADAKPTDVITFEGEATAGQAGEICVCPDVAAEYAADNELDFEAEVALYVIHGYLHLCGFDDRDPASRRKMRAAEKAAVACAKAANAMPCLELRK